MRNYLDKKRGGPESSDSRVNRSRKRHGGRERWETPEKTVLADKTEGDSEFVPFNSGKGKSFFNMNHDYYADLELTPDADGVAISSQYRKLALKNHPDRHSGHEAEFIGTFQAIGVAHNILSDPIVRHRYDQARTEHRSPGNPVVFGSREFATASQQKLRSPLAPKQELPNTQIVNITKGTKEAIAQGKLTQDELIYPDSYEYLCHIAEARIWLLDVLNSAVLAPVLQLEDALRDGVTLADVAVRLSKSFPQDQQHVNISRHRIFRSPRLQFRHSDNIALFFRFLAAVDLPEAFRFDLVDLYDRRHMPKVIYCIHALAWLLYRRGATDFGLADLVGKLRFEEQELKEGQRTIDRSYGPMPSFEHLRKSFREEELASDLTPISAVDESFMDLTDMCVDLQAQIRGVLVRLGLGDLLQHLWDKEERVEHLQAIARGGFKRASVRTMFSTDRSIEKLQAAAKGFILRRQEDQERRARIRAEEAVIKLQLVWRRRRQRADLSARRQLLIEDPHHASTNDANATTSQAFAVLTTATDEPNTLIKAVEQYKAARGSISDGVQEAEDNSEIRLSRGLRIALRDLHEADFLDVSLSDAGLYSQPSPAAIRSPTRTGAGFSRLLNEPETLAFDRFNGHASECLSCDNPQDTSQVGDPLCDWGLYLGRDVTALAYERDGEVYSMEEEDENVPVRLEMPAGYDQVHALLRLSKRWPQGAQGMGSIPTSVGYPIDRRAEQVARGATNASPVRDASKTEIRRSASTNSSEMIQWAFRNKDGTWTCAYPGCTSLEVFSNGRDLLEHRTVHTDSPTRPPQTRWSPEQGNECTNLSDSILNGDVPSWVSDIAAGLRLTTWLRLFRARPGKGCQRLEWICSCGRSMYGDYAEHESTVQSSLTRSLPKCVVLPKWDRFSASSMHPPVLKFAANTIGAASVKPHDYSEVDTMECITRESGGPEKHTLDKRGHLNTSRTQSLLKRYPQVITFAFVLTPFSLLIGFELKMGERVVHEPRDELAIAIRALAALSILVVSSFMLIHLCEWSLPEPSAASLDGLSYLLSATPWEVIRYYIRRPIAIFRQQAQHFRPSAVSLSTTDGTTSNAPGDNSSQTSSSVTGQANSEGTDPIEMAHLRPTGGQSPIISTKDYATKPGSFAVPAFFELCVNRNKTQISLGEIQLADGKGQELVKNDMELFAEIRKRYETLRRKGPHRFLYRPFDIQFVRFGVQRGGFQTGIYQAPLAIPPETEVKEQRYHYYECPLDPLPPIDARTFFHYFWEHASHPPCSGNPAFDTLFYNRLPKKLGTSMLLQTDPGKLHLGWGVHIIEGPNKPLLAWIATGILVFSFLISVLYDIILKNKDSGFAIGQWIVAVLTAALTALYFHLADMA